MDEQMVLQGRTVTAGDISLIQRLIAQQPSWNRTRLSRELCQLWSWRATNGQVKDMACRSLLLKLEALGLVILPARQNSPVNASRNRSIQYVLHDTTPVLSTLKALSPVRIERVEGTSEHDLFRCLLSRYHYLGYSGSVGENMKYLISDSTGRPLACLLFGSAAWKTASRDLYIGWDARGRRQNLSLITNNMRFLILPWVRVPYLASHILARIARRINADWLTRYSHPVVLLETFVDVHRFRGVCYRAANWIYVGRTQGRSRNDRSNTMRVPPKDIYLYPLSPRFREFLVPQGS